MAVYCDFADLNNDDSPCELLVHSPAEGQWIIDNGEGGVLTYVTCEEMRASLLALREDGYRFPDAVLAQIDEELALKSLES